MANKIIHKHSSAALSSGKAKLPTNEQIDYGEIAINYSKGLETISIKNNANEIVKFNARYDSNITDKNTSMPNAVGGLSGGTTVAQLSGFTVSEMFDNILFPTTNPSHTNPSVGGFVLSSTNTPVKVGSSAHTITVATLNRGVWTEFNNNAPYAGTETTTAYEFTINGTKYTGTNSLPSLPSTYTNPGNHTYKVTINYSKGAAPKNNKGQIVDSLAAPASSVTATRTVNVTYPWYASTSAAGTLTEQKLIAWSTTVGGMSTGSFTLKPQVANATVSNKQTFKIPRQANTIETLNTLSGKWESSVNSWEYTTGTTNDITYYTYNLKSNSSNGEQTVKVTF